MLHIRRSDGFPVREEEGLLFSIAFRAEGIMLVGVAERGGTNES
jgi:hypothetical protein